MKVGATCRLKMGSDDNIVAVGTIFETDTDDDFVKVSIDLVMDGDCKVPVPSNSEDKNVLSQEIGSHLLWPRNLVILDEKKVTLTSLKCIRFSFTMYIYACILTTQLFCV